AASRNIALAVNYLRRYSESHVRIRDWIRSGRIGAIQKVAGLYTKGVFHNGTHWFDLARWMIGEIAQVKALSAPASETDPTLDAGLLFDNGARGVLQGCDADAFSVFEMDIIGTLGRVRLVDSGHRVETYQAAESPYYSGYLALRKEEDRVGDLGSTGLRALEDLVQSLEQRVPPRCSGADGLAALRIASAVVRSAAEGTEIHLSPSGR
ncbi:MAG TPA: Gfo/Idh/MocA family oxidoreductase, partial [Planctomycetota bacterium]|nr:Gfo/Idh/MocA family oxidoreductase [Planctomycetota bacterium]